MNLLLLPGDGIGPEIAGATKVVLTAASEVFDLGIEFTDDIVGHASLRQFGTTVRPELLDMAKQADGLILGPTATNDFKDESKGEINPSAFFRKGLDLFANIRPARTYAGLPSPVGEFNLLVVRENTEGFYADRNMAQGSGEILVTPDVSIAIRRITRDHCERIARAAFELATRRRSHVTIVHKANVFKISDGMFIEECERVATDYPGVEVDDVIVDAMMAHVVRNPRRFDVVVTTNMYGDILSDLTAELSGSLGLGSSLNAGHDDAMAQAAHGSAPDIAGKNIANPLSLILSASELLAWHGRRSGLSRFIDAAASIERASEMAIGMHEVTPDIGGTFGTDQVASSMAARITAS